MRRRKWIAVVLLLAALLVGALLWWLKSDPAPPFDESEVWTVEVQAPGPRLACATAGLARPCGRV